MQIKEFYPSDIRTPINVYYNSNLVTDPFVAIRMADQPNTETNGWIDIVTLFHDDNGNRLHDKEGNLLWLISDGNLEDDWHEQRKMEKELGLLDKSPRPTPDIRRYYGKVKWELK